MKQFVFSLICLILFPALVKADPPPPPVPVPMGNDSDQMPPVDISRLTPVSLPPAQNTPIPPTEKNMKTEPTPAKPSPTSVTPKQEPSTPTPGTTEPDQSENSAGTPASLGALTDYFPLSEGAQWNYEYLKPVPGQTAKGSYAVKCVSVKTQPNGTVQAVLETALGSQTIRDRYSLYANQVEHTATNENTLKGDFVFKIPSKGKGSTWTGTAADGTILKCKSAFGKAQVLQETYSDCIVVTVKTVTNGKKGNTLIYYYAKGIGLVAKEVYSDSMKLIQNESVALVSGPGAQ